MVAKTIGKIAEQAGVNLETIRYYERRGLLQRPMKRNGTFRYYPETVVQEIRFIKRAQELGFTLKEIKQLLSLRTTAGAKCNAVRKKAQSKLDEIDVKLKTLQSIRNTLSRMVDT